MTTWDSSMFCWRVNLLIPVSRLISFKLRLFFPTTEGNHRWIMKWVHLKTMNIKCTNYTNIERIITINSIILKIKISPNKTVALLKLYQLVTFFYTSTIDVNLWLTVRIMYVCIYACVFYTSFYSDAFCKSFLAYKY